MYHYLFTNDLRISTLGESLKHAAVCFRDGTVPSHKEDKSANNNMKTLGFYFNLTEDSVCTAEAANGNVRGVVLNFIKKFQFPNIRTTESYNDCKSDGIILAPMRMIVKLLYSLYIEYGEESAKLSRQEIKNFIFYNEEVAKKRNPNIANVILQILKYRETKMLPTNISTNEKEHVWKQEDRQIREMLKILDWSGCAVNDGEFIYIKNENLNRDNKADIFDIICYQNYWDGDTEESYRHYMDMDKADVLQDSNHNNNDEERVTGAQNIIFYGVPGTGKSYKIKKDYCNDNNYMERVVFHPDYTYSDFVGQILPKVEDGDLKYEFTPGPFTSILKAAIEDKTHYYYLVIEELNRGNAPAIFGELFQLLDRKNSGEYPDDQIGESEYSITNFDISKEIYGFTSHEVRIPSNLFILATMNTSDQNVFTLDTAFQRRWQMEHIPNDFSKSKYKDTKIDGSEISWENFAETVNSIILESEIGMIGAEDKRLGAYFVKISDLSTKYFPEKVLKYLWDDAFKMDRTILFDSRFKALDEVIETYEKTSGDRIKAVLRDQVYSDMLNRNSNE